MYIATFGPCAVLLFGLFWGQGREHGQQSTTHQTNEIVVAIKVPVRVLKEMYHCHTSFYQAADQWLDSRMWSGLEYARS